MSSSIYLRRFLLYISSSLVLLTGCNNYAEPAPKDTLDSGVIYISADESFEPIINSEIQVFEAQHPMAKIIPFYKPEADCIRDFAVDSIRMVIITRTFTQQEENFIVDSFRLAPRSLTVARDAISVILNPAAQDSLFSMEEIRQILTGRFKENLIPIFDGTRATSTVRFAIDSILHGDSLSPRTMAAKNSEGVIDYVSRNPNAIGFIGVSWIGNHEDTAAMSFLKKVKMASLASRNDTNVFILPWQRNIYLNRYPMIRDLVYILKEKNDGLGKNFGAFLSGEKGQLIFKRAYLWPTQMDFNVRLTKLNE